MTDQLYLMTEAQRNSLLNLNYVAASELLQSLPMVSAEPAAKQTKGETSVELDFHSDNTSNGQQRELVGKMEVGQSLGDRAHKSESNTEPERAIALIRDIDEHGPLLGWFSHWANYPIGTKLYTSPPPLQPITADDVTDSLCFETGEDKEKIVEIYNAVATNLVKPRSEEK